MIVCLREENHAVRLDITGTKNGGNCLGQRKFKNKKTSHVLYITMALSMKAKTFVSSRIET